MFTMWVIYWAIVFYALGQSMAGDHNSTNAADSLVAFGVTFDRVNQIATGFIAATILLLLITAFVERSATKSLCLYCSIISVAICFAAHLGTASQYFPVIRSAWNRSAHVLLLGEWIALAPFQMVMLHTLDGMAPNDIKFMWISAMTQALPSIAGQLASAVPVFA